jgi:hypothetical protein
MGALRDDEKEELEGADGETRRKRILSRLLGGYGMFGNAPFFGNAPGALADMVITGEVNTGSMKQDMMPGVGNAVRLFGDFTNDAETHKIIIDVLRIVLMYSGTGYGTLTDLYRTAFLILP